MPKVKRSAGHEGPARGDILWLNPWPSELIECSKPVHDIFDHPVMIVSLDIAGKRARVLIVSANASAIHSFDAEPSNVFS